MATNVDLDHLRQEGYIRVEGAVSERLCRDVLEAIVEVSGLSHLDRSTWYRAEPALEGIVPLWGHPSQWAIRQLPDLHRTWSRLWRRDDLLVSLDRCRFTPPWIPGYADPLELHWDLDPSGPLHTFQGFVALTPCRRGEGGFRCAPSWYRDRTRWLTLGPCPQSH